MVKELAKRIFQRKVATGMYNHYPKVALRQLYFDCLNQAIMTYKTMGVI